MRSVMLFFSRRYGDQSDKQVAGTARLFFNNQL